MPTETTQPIKPGDAQRSPPPPLPPSTDGTLTPVPHVVAVATGLFTGWATTKLGLPTQYASYAAILVATLLTSAVHFLQAKLDE